MKSNVTFFWQILVNIQKRYKFAASRHYTTALLQGQFRTTHERTNMAVLCPSGWSHDSQLDRHTWLHIAFASFPPPCLLLQEDTLINSDIAFNPSDVPTTTLH